MDEKEKLDRFIYHNDVFDAEDRKVVENAFGKSANEKLFPKPDEIQKKIKRKPLVERVKGDDAGQESQRTCASLMDLVRENVSLDYKKMD
jgi:hypothetical protein